MTKKTKLLSLILVLAIMTSFLLPFGTAIAHEDFEEEEDHIETELVPNYGTPTSSYCFYTVIKTWGWDYDGNYVVLTIQQYTNPHTLNSNGKCTMKIGNWSCQYG
ncbi:MAG: hypothetical protein FWG88_05780 [Oscillospiraceae bacterium]|nr:hypothetical protein [Oscillospiraceae bacterium]